MAIGAMIIKGVTSILGKGAIQVGKGVVKGTVKGAKKTFSSAVYYTKRFRKPFSVGYWQSRFGRRYWKGKGVTWEEAKKREAEEYERRAKKRKRILEKAEEIKEKRAPIVSAIYSDVKKFGESASKVMMKMEVINPIEIAKSIMDSMYRVTYILLAIAGIAGMVYIVQVEYVLGTKPLFTDLLKSVGELMATIGYWWIAIAMLAYGFAVHWGRGAK